MKERRSKERGASKIDDETNCSEKKGQERVVASVSKWGVTSIDEANREIQRLFQLLQLSRGGCDAAGTTERSFSFASQQN